MGRKVNVLVQSYKGGILMSHVDPNMVFLFLRFARFFMLLFFWH